MSVTLVEIARDASVRQPGIKLADTPAAVCQATAEMYQTTGFNPPWIGYLALSAGTCVGTCAFKSAPSDGAVEIACFTFPGNEGLGVASAMVRQLIDIAYAADGSLKIVAHTPPNRGAPAAVLQKSGFLLLGHYDDPMAGPVWEWEFIR